MEKYDSLEMEILFFERHDVITESCTEDDISGQEF